MNTKETENTQIQMMCFLYVTIHQKGIFLLGLYTCRSFCLMLYKSYKPPTSLFIHFFYRVIHESGALSKKFSLSLISHNKFKNAQTLTSKSL